MKNNFIWDFLPYVKHWRCLRLNLIEVIGSVFANDKFPAISYMNCWTIFAKGFILDFCMGSISNISNIKNPVFWKSFSYRLQLAGGTKCYREKWEKLLFLLGK